MLRTLLHLEIVCLIFAFACSAPPPSKLPIPTGTGGNSPQPQASVQGEPPKAPSLSPQPPSPLPVVATPAVVFDDSLLNGKEFLLQASEVGLGKLPQDYSLGRLASASDPNPSGAASKLFLHFLDELSKGKIPENTLVERWKDQLLRNLNGMLSLKSTWKKWRVGSWNVVSEGGLFAPFWVESDVGRASGYAYLVEVEKEWKVSDLQIDWNELTVAKSPSAELFDPESLKTNLVKP